MPQNNFLSNFKSPIVTFGIYDILKLKGKHFKVTKCEIFDHSDFHEFCTMKPLGEGDIGVKIKEFLKNI
jgi:hypothetical protein